MRKLTGRFAWLAALATAAAASGEECRLAGRVVDPAGRPVAATVTVVGGGASRTTDAEGRFCFDALETGRHELVVVAPGFSIGGGSVELGDADREIEIPLAPAFGEEVVVTTTGTERRLADSPIHVQTFGRRQLEDVAARTLADAVEWTPGLRVESNCQNCSTTQVRMLGLDGAYTQLLVDGQPTVSSLALVYGVEQLPARLIDSIEVVKGGASALYGGGAIAGVINLIPHDASSNGVVVETRASQMGGVPGSSLNAGVDWVGSAGRTSWTLYGQRDRVGAADLDGDQFTEVTRRRFEALGLRGARYLFADRARLSIDLSATAEDRRGGDLAAIDLPPEASRVAEEIVSERSGGSIAWLHSARSGAFDYRLAASYSRTERDSYYGSDFDPDAYGSTDNPLWVFDARIHHYRDRGTFTWGLQRSEERIDDRQPGYDRFLAERYRSTGLFGQHDVRLGRRVTALYGARIDEHSGLDEPIVSPRGALLWAPRDNVAVRAAVARGFRPPISFDEDLHIALVGGGETRVVRNASDLEPETSLNRSLSFEWRPEVGRSGSALLEAQLFRTTIDGLFHSVETDDPATAQIELTKINQGAATVEGIEVSGAFRWRSAWSVEAGFVRQQARFGDPEPDFGSRDFFRTPERYGNALVSWTPGPADVFLGLRYTGSMKAPHYAGFIDTDRLETTPSFLTADLNVARTIPLGDAASVRLSIGARNLTDAYQRDLDRGPLRDPSYVYGPRFPRSLWVGLRFQR